MLAYKPDIDPTFFSTRFIDGLHNAIKAVVLIQQPQNLETVVSFALLQEEISEDCYQSAPLGKSVSFSRVNSKALTSAMSLNNNNNNFKQRHGNTSEDKKVQDPPRQASSALKFQALKNYRNAMNLCFKCGEKYSPQHQCAATVQLHLVEELLEMLDGSQSPESYTTAADDAII
jgi:hypothetical protein